MLWRVWLLAFIGAVLLTAAWLFIERRLEISTLFAGAIWSWCFVTTDNLELWNAGSTRVVEVGAFRWLILGFALLSLLAFAGVLFEFYPPEQYGLDGLKNRAETNRDSTSRKT